MHIPSRLELAFRHYGLGKKKLFHNLTDVDKE